MMQPMQQQGEPGAQCFMVWFIWVYSYSWHCAIMTESSFLQPAEYNGNLLIPSMHSSQPPQTTRIMYSAAVQVRRKGVKRS